MQRYQPYPQILQPQQHHYFMIESNLQSLQSHSNYYIRISVFPSHLLIPNQLLVPLLAVPLQKLQLIIHVLVADVRVAHHISPKIVVVLPIRGISDQDLPIVYHVLLGEDVYLAQGFEELLVLCGSSEFLRDVVITYVEGCCWVHQDPCPIRVQYSICQMVCQRMLGFYMGSDSFPTVSFEVSPTFQDIDGSTALQCLISSVQGLLVGFSVLVEDNICLCRIAILKESHVRSQEECGLKRDHKSFVGIPGYGVDIATVAYFMAKFVSHEECPTERSIHMSPDPVFLTDPRALLDRINRPCDRRSNSNVGKIRHLPSFQTLLNFSFQLRGYHLPSVIGLNTDDVIQSQPFQDGSLGN